VVEEHSGQMWRSLPQEMLPLFTHVSGFIPHKEENFWDHNFVIERF
jgi:hypothetical protein